jgi:hypothetical protein
LIAAGVPRWEIWDESGMRRVPPDTSYGSYSLFCANKQLYEECSEILFANTPFVLNVGRLILLEPTYFPRIESWNSVLTQEKVEAIWKSLRSFDKVILRVEHGHVRLDFTERNLEIILCAFLGTTAKKDPKKKIVIRLVFKHWFWQYDGSTYLIDIMQTWLPKSTVIRLQCESAIVNEFLTREWVTDRAVLRWKDFFMRFSDRIDMEVEEDSGLGIVAT